MSTEAGETISSLKPVKEYSYYQVLIFTLIPERSMSLFKAQTENLKKKQQKKSSLSRLVCMI